jgi:hypothetical protein
MEFMADWQSEYIMSILIRLRRKRVTRWASTSMTYALIPGKCLASAATRITIGGSDRQDSGDARRTTAAELLAVAFFEKFDVIILCTVLPVYSRDPSVKTACKGKARIAGEMCSKKSFGSRSGWRD